MIRRSSRILLEVIGCAGAGLAILVGLAAWRLTSDDPVRLRFLTPYLEEALSASDGSYTVRIGDTVLTWGGWRRQLDLRASDVHLIDATGAEVATVPEIALSVSFRALLSGTIAPRAIELIGPHLVLERAEDGRFLLGEATSSPEVAAGLGGSKGALLPLLLAQLQRDGPDAPRFLREVGIVDGSLTVQDRMAGLRWEAPDADIFLRRTPEGLAAVVDLELAQFGRPARLSADLIYDRAEATVQVEARVSGIDAPALGLIDPSLMLLTGADLVLDGSFSTQTTLDGRIGEARFELNSGPGLLSLPSIFDQPLSVQSVVLRGTADPSLGSIDIDESYLALDGVRLDLDATLRDVGNDDVVLAATIGADRLSVDDLKRYWPVDAGRNGRRWVVANIFDGAAENARLDLRVRLPGGTLDAVKVEDVHGSFDGRDLTVHYFKGLPPIRNGHGKARFDQNAFIADIAGGDSQGIDIRSARLAITRLSEPWQFIAVDGQVEGTLRETLELLEGGELQYASKLGIDPAHADGAIATSLSVSLPAAIRELSEVEITAEATLKQAVLGSAVLGRDLTGGDLRLTLDKQGMDVEGTARVAGIPARLTWRENFADAPYRSQIALAATTYPDQRMALGLDLMPYVDGPVGTDLLYTRAWSDRSSLAARFNLDRATLVLAALDWRKAPGQAGHAAIDAELDGGNIVGVPRLTIEAGTLLAEGHGLAEAGEPLAGLALDRLRVGLTDLSDVTLRRVGERIDITASGGVFDAEPVLKRRDAAAKAGGEVQPASAAFTVRTSRLDQLRLGPDQALADVRLGLHHDGAAWQEVQLDATLLSGEPLVLRYLPDGPGRHRLTVAAENAGGALQLLGLSNGMIGGRLSIAAVSDDTLPGQPLTGRAVVYDFRLFRAPVLARVLAIATFTGLVDTLTGGDGFLFDRFIGDFTKTGQRIDVELARAYGASLGITAEGTVDLGTETVDLKGTLIPLFAFNNLLANIPVLGDLLTAGQGGGIFAATYRAEGSLNAPEVSVNPMAALAPGVLRELFDLGEAGVSRATPEERPLPGRGGKD